MLRKFGTGKIIRTPKVAQQFPTPTLEEIQRDGDEDEKKTPEQAES